jgi:hypothetical protein
MNRLSATERLALDVKRSVIASDDLVFAALTDKQAMREEQV